MLGAAESDNINFAGVGVHRVLGRTINGSQLGLFDDNIGTESQKICRSQPKEKFDPLYGRNRRSCGRFPPFIMTTDALQRNQGQANATSSMSSSQPRKFQAPRAALMKPTLSDLPSLCFSNMLSEPLATSMSASTSCSTNTTPFLSAPFENHSRSVLNSLTDKVSIQADDLGTPHLSSPSSGTIRASPTSLLTVPPNLEVSRSFNSIQKDEALCHTDVHSFQQLGPYRQSGLEALDMAFWNGGNFYSDDESDLEHNEHGTRVSPVEGHTELSSSKSQVDFRHQVPLFPTRANKTTSDTSMAVSNALSEYLNDILIDDYLDSGLDQDDPAICRSSYPSSVSLSDDEAWLNANKRKSQVVPKLPYGLTNPKLTACEPLRAKEALPPLPPKLDGEPKCKHCHQKILGKVVRSADGLFSGLYHRECLRCIDCNTNLFQTNIFVLNDQTYCSKDFHVRNGSLCKKCGLGIEGIYRLTWNNMCYHTHCFVCAYNDPSSGVCRAELDEYYMVHAKPYCEDHARKLVKQLYIQNRKM